METGRAKCCQVGLGRNELHEGLSREFAGCLRYLVGRLKTLVDATSGDAVQRKATKDMLDHIVYHDFGDQFYRILAEILLGEKLVSMRADALYIPPAEEVEKK